MRNPFERILLVSAVFALAGALAWTPPAAAANVSFTLYADNNNGWGLTASSLRTPGPPLAVDLGDNVTLVLRSTDGNNYRWYLDYNNDSNRNTNEPRSPQFGGTAVTWNFTADRAGTFRYRAQNAPSLMWGNLTVRNATSPPPGTPGTTFRIDPSLLIVVGIVVAFIGTLVVAGMVARRKQEKKA
jgi:hypothetical protein